MSEQLINSISISYEDNGIITTLTATSMDELVGKIEAFGCVNIALRYLTKSKDALTKDQTAHLFYTIAKSGNFAELYALSRIIPEFYISISKRMVERFIIEANKDNWKKMLAQLNTFLRSHDMHHERQQAFELIISADNYRFNKNAVLLCLSRYKFSDAQAVMVNPGADAAPSTAINISSPFSSELDSSLYISAAVSGAASSMAVS